MVRKVKNRYYAYFNCKYYGAFDTPEEAQQAVDNIPRVPRKPGAGGYRPGSGRKKKK